MRFFKRTLLTSPLMPNPPPNFHSSIARTASQTPPIRTKRHRQNLPPVARQNFQQTPRTRIPQINCAIPTPRRQNPTIGTERHTQNIPRIVPHTPQQRSSPLSIHPPQLRRTIPTPRRQNQSFSYSPPYQGGAGGVRSKNDRPHPIPVLC